LEALQYNDAVIQRANEGPLTSFKLLDVDDDEGSPITVLLLSLRIGEGAVKCLARSRTLPALSVGETARLLGGGFLRLEDKPEEERNLGQKGA
jgi:hypothetical protein